MFLQSRSVDDTRAIAAALAGWLRAGDIVVLSGEMGAGKTAFAQGVGAALGVDQPLTSPTFTLVNSYDCDRFTVHHADLYRVERTTELADLALAELAEFSGVVLVEWGEVAADALGDHLLVHLEVDDPDDDDLDVDVRGDDVDMWAPSGRVITIDAVGERWVGRWDRLRAAVESAC